MSSGDGPRLPGEIASDREGEGGLEDRKITLILLNGSGKTREARRRRPRVGKRRPEWEETGPIPSIHGFPASVAQGGRMYGRGGAPGMLGED